MQKFLKKMFYMGVDLTAQSVEKMETTIKEIVKKEEGSVEKGEKIIAEFIKKTEKNKEFLESKINVVLKKVSLRKAKKGIQDVLNEDELKDTLNIKGNK